MLDEVALTKHDLCGNSSRQSGPQLFQRGLDATRELQRIKTRRFVDAEHHAHRAIHTGVTAHRLHRVFDLRHIADEHRTVAHGLDDGMRDVFQTCRHAEIAHHDLARTGLQITAGRISRRKAHRSLNLFKRDAISRQTMRIRLHLNLLHATTDGEHLRHTADALKATLDRPIRECAQFHRQNFAILAAQTDEQNFTHQRRNGRHARLGTFRQ